LCGIHIAKGNDVVVAKIRMYQPLGLVPSSVAFKRRASPTSSQRLWDTSHAN
jgi:hypothetical protein